MENYVEIENSYRDKFVKMFLDEYPTLLTEKYVIQEKIHGTNIRLCFENGKMTLGSRNKELGEGENHMGLLEALSTVEPVIKYLKTIKDHQVTIFGELFGEGIQKVIKYGKKRILFFDIMVDGVLWPYDKFLQLVGSFAEYIVPQLAIVNNLNIALDYICEFKSTLCDDQAEGIVIKPYFKNYFHNDEVFYLKKKPEKFAEKTSTEKKERPASPLLPYINENRLNSVFSKEGKITSKTEMAKYIHLITDDAIKDYNKDHPELELSVDDKRVSTQISRLLLKEL